MFETASLLRELVEVPEWPCKCDEQGIGGKSGVTCGDCPRDYGHKVAEPMREPVALRERWNIERDGDDLLVCFNLHEKGEKCAYQRFVPAHLPQQRVPLTDEQMVACVLSIGVPAPMGLIRDRGAYEVTEPTWFLTKLVRAIEKAHKITGEQK